MSQPTTTAKASIGPMAHRGARRRRCAPRRWAGCLGCALVACAQGALAQSPPVTLPGGGDLRASAHRVLAVMSYSMVPDVTSSALSLQDTRTGNQGLSILQMAGGFSPRKHEPLYLEGGLALSQYDPVFVIGDTRQAQAESTASAHWTGLSATGGVGWDFRLSDDLVWRPILNASLGRVSSELQLPGLRPELAGDPAYDFLGHGHLDVAGLGGSLMLDYERYRPEGEIDVELRYTAIRLRNVGSTASVVQGQADVSTASLWARWRAPTGLTALQRPLRYVLEAAHTHYLGDQAGVLGFHYLNSLGVGLELDSSARDTAITRTRLMLRYVVGGDVSGVTVGVAMSFWQ